MLSMAPIVMPQIPRHILNGGSVKYFHETRTKRFGMPLDEFEKSKKGREGVGECEASFVGSCQFARKTEGLSLWDKMVSARTDPYNGCSLRSYEWIACL